MSKKSEKKWGDLTQQQKDTAKEKYMSYQSISSISKYLNIPRTTVQYHANRYWDAERELLRAELYNQFTKTKKALFVDMSENAMQIVSKSMKHLASRQTPPTTREAKDATAILESLDKITRLDEGKPTEITEEKVMELSEIKDIANLIPFKKKVVNKEESDE